MENQHSDQPGKLNEKKLVTKRAYTESHPAKTVGMTAKIRNKMLEAIKDGKVATGEFDRILKELSSKKIQKYGFLVDLIKQFQNCQTVK